MRFTAETRLTADGDPGLGCCAGTTPRNDATMLFLDDSTSDGASITGMWPVIEQGGFIYIQNRLEESRWQIWEITRVEPAGYVKLGVSLIACLGTLLTATR